jgi:hypothetical protein
MVHDEAAIPFCRLIYNMQPVKDGTVNVGGKTPTSRFGVSNELNLQITTLE